jgi:signal transduction histidine kinase
VRADLGMIERVLTNLLDNAIRHTPPGTHITVSLRPEHDRVEVEVRDTGPGIPEAMRAGLFTRASRLLKGAQQGGGLGLVIVQRILQLHGDGVRLGDGPGAAFRFTLPAG